MHTIEMGSSMILRLVPFLRTAAFATCKECLVRGDIDADEGLAGTGGMCFFTISTKLILPLKAIGFDIVLIAFHRISLHAIGQTWRK